MVLRAYQLWLHIQTNTVENSWNLCNMVNLNYFQGHSILCESDEWEVGLRDTVLCVSKMLTLPLLKELLKFQVEKKKITLSNKLLFSQVFVPQNKISVRRKNNY